MPTGDDYFANVISENKYYVDKTLYLKSVFENDCSPVLLFTRPRRFGKTLLMNMFADFLRIKNSVKGDEQEICSFFLTKFIPSSRRLHRNNYF